MMRPIVWVPTLETTSSIWPSICTLAEDRGEEEAAEEEMRANLGASSSLTKWMWKKSGESPTWTWKKTGGRLTTSGMTRAYLQ